MTTTTQGGTTNKAASTGRNPENLTQLRRHLRTGMILRRTHSLGLGGPTADLPVGKVQGNAFTVVMPDGRLSWHYYGAASDYTFTPDSFTVRIPQLNATVEYRFLTPAPLTAQERPDTHE